MTAATINKVNAEISKHGVELVKGNGYFYFADLEGAETYNADHIESVFSNVLRCMTLDEWIEHVEVHLSDN